MKIALTASINLARYIGLLTFKRAYEDYDFTDLELQTCPLELNVGRISCNSRDVHLKGVCRGNEFSMRVGLSKLTNGRWKIGGVLGTYDDCTFGWHGVYLASALGVEMDSLTSAV